MDYGGMTVNERLYVSGLIDDFDKAIKNNDLETLKSIVKKIDLDESYLKTIIEDFNLKNNI